MTRTDPPSDTRDEGIRPPVPEGAVHYRQRHHPAPVAAAVQSTLSELCRARARLRGSWTAAIPARCAPVQEVLGTASDFSVAERLKTGPQRRCRITPEALADWHIHHLDLKHRNVFWCRCAAPIDPGDPAFYYAEVRQRAVETCETRLEDVEAPLSAAITRPVLFFSIGRCGSTLLSRLLNAAGLLSWSEPDGFTSLAVDQRRARRTPGLSKRMVRMMLGDLSVKSAQLGAPAFGIKFRSEVTTVCDLVLAAAPEAPVFFMVRDPLDWARSFNRLGWGDPDTLAWRLAGMVADIRALRAGGREIGVLSYEEMTASPEAVVARIAVAFGRPVAQGNTETTPGPDLGAVMAVDSQHGTGVSRDDGRASGGDFDMRFRAALLRVAPDLLETPPASWFG